MIRVEAGLLLFGKKQWTTRFVLKGGFCMEIKIGENIKRLRKAKSVTQEQIAEVLGISVTAVSKWERGVSHS